MTQINQLLKDISRLGRAYRDEKLAPLGINSRYALFLREIGAAPGISQEQLTGRIGINKSNVARQVAAMEEEGYICRHSCGQDKRVLRLHLTQKAEALMPAIEQVMDDWESKLLEGLTPQQQETLYALLAQLRKNGGEKE